MTALLEEARRRLAAARQVAALTGAGVSAESGIPTFRGEGGLWEDHRPEELATPEAFQRDPALVWRFYRWRREVVLGASPNAGHEALAEFASRRELALITQNVDGLHRLAGSRDVVELHGCLLASRCERCDLRVAMEDEPTDEVPCCGHCPGRLRPDVVWFGEALPVEAWERAWAAAESCDAFLLLGTADADGHCDVSPRGDAPGFCLVLDEQTLVIPDRPSNKRFDSLSNILAHGAVGLLFMIPTIEETLRVNGRAQIVCDPDLLARLEARGKVPQLAIVVEVEEAFIHCAKSLKRSFLSRGSRLSISKSANFTSRRSTE